MFNLFLISLHQLYSPSSKSYPGVLSACKEITSESKYSCLEGVSHIDFPSRSRPSSGSPTHILYFVKFPWKSVVNCSLYLT